MPQYLSTDPNAGLPAKPVKYLSTDPNAGLDEEKPGAASRFASGFGRGVIGGLEGLAGMVMHPIDAATEIVAQPIRQIQKAGAEVGRGNYLRAAADLGGAVPLVGGMALDLGERTADTGDVAGAAGEIVGNIALGKGLAKAPGALRRGAPMVGDAASVMGSEMAAALPTAGAAEVIASGVGLGGGAAAGAVLTYKALRAIPKAFEAVKAGIMKREGISGAAAERTMIEMPPETLAQTVKEVAPKAYDETLRSHSPAVSPERAAIKAANTARIKAERQAYWEKHPKPAEAVPARVEPLPAREVNLPKGEGPYPELTPEQLAQIERDLAPGGRLGPGLAPDAEPVKAPESAQPSNIVDGEGRPLSLTPEQRAEAVANLPWNKGKTVAPKAVEVAEAAKPEAKPKSGKPMKVEYFDPETGRNVRAFIRPEDLEGRTFEPPKSAKEIAALKGEAKPAEPAKASSAERFKRVREDEPVDGLSTGGKIKNLSSIDSSLTEWDELPGVRQVDFSDFGDGAKTSANHGYANAADSRRVVELADQIKNSGRIDPLIVVYDKQGPYILEGGHRFEALKLLGKKSFPAKVVVDTAEGMTLEDLSKAGRVTIQPELVDRIGKAVSPQAAFDDLKLHGAGDGLKIPAAEARQMVDEVWKAQDPGYKSIEQWMMERRDKWDAMRQASPSSRSGNQGLGAELAAALAEDGKVPAPAALAGKVASEIQSKPVKRYYHATSEPFDSFDFSRLGEETRRNATEPEAVKMAELGAWANNQKLSSRIGATHDLPVEVQFSKPLRTSFLQMWKQASKYKSGTAWREALIKRGYDGVILKDSEFGGESVVSLDPKKIKIISERTASPSTRSGNQGKGADLAALLEQDGKVPSKPKPTTPKAKPEAEPWKQELEQFVEREMDPESSFPADTRGAWVRALTEAQKTQPRPLAKMFGQNLTPENVARHSALMKAYNGKVRFIKAQIKKAEGK